jgi:hypothetical protein
MSIMVSRLLALHACASLACGTDHRPDLSLAGAQAIFDDHCVECHTPPMPDGNLSLESEDARTQLIGVKTAAYCGIEGIRVVPGDPAMSCLWVLLEEDVMPLDNPPLSAAKKQTIYNWILNGAPE